MSYLNDADPISHTAGAEGRGQYRTPPGQRAGVNIAHRWGRGQGSISHTAGAEGRGQYRTPPGQRQGSILHTTGAKGRDCI